MSTRIKELARDTLSALSDCELSLRLSEWDWGAVYDVASLYSGGPLSRQGWIDLVSWLDVLAQDRAADAFDAGDENFDEWERDAKRGRWAALRWFDARRAGVAA